MTHQKPQFYFLFALLLAVAVLTFYVFKPFLIPLLLATFVAIAFKPVHRKILSFMPKWKSMAAFFTVLCVIAFVVVPAFLIGTQIVREAKNVYLYLVQGGGNEGILMFFHQGLQNLQVFLPFDQDIAFNIEQSLQQALGWIIGNAGTIVSNIASFGLALFLFLMALFYLFRDGGRAREFFIKLSPLGNRDDEHILKRLEISAKAVVEGTLLIAVAQGFCTTVAFMIFGVPNPVLWGSLAALSALVPGVGVGLIFLPAVVYLLVTSGALVALGLAAFGVGVVGLVDNVLAPHLFGRGAEIHPLLVLLSILGGIFLFGAVGIFVGPILIALLLVLLEIYFSMVHSNESKA